MEIEKNDMVMVYDGAALFPTASIPAGSVTLRHTGRRLSRMRFICSGWGRARSATGWFYSASLGHRIHRTAFAKELKGHRERDAPLFRCNVNRERGNG